MEEEEEKTEGYDNSRGGQEKASRWGDKHVVIDNQFKS